jgi:homoserine kinase type II
MAVYTEVTLQEAAGLLQSLGLGELCAMQGCKGGIENTNYFVSTQRAGQTYDYVLTLFERLHLEQLPFYLRLMKHLAERGICLPTPHANTQGELVFMLKGKPAAVVDKLQGSSELSPGAAHCAQVGAMLARMHLAGSDFVLQQPNLRGLPWWNETVGVVLPFLSAEQSELIQDELAYQNQLAGGADYASLPRGPIHADLFRDNVMFTVADGQPILSGFFDFYFAGVDSFLFDIAVCLNDWCIDLEQRTPNPMLTDHFLTAYQAVRPLTPAELRLLPAMLRAGALRFWLSRLWDLHLPRQASLLKPHDPMPFERLLRERRAQAGVASSYGQVGEPCA